MDRPTTLKEKARITAGAVASLVIVADSAGDCVPLGALTTPIRCGSVWRIL